MGRQSQRKIYFYFTLLFILGLCWYGCKKKESAEPENPFASLSTSDEVPIDSINASTFLGLHKNIFAVKCANPGCHDGSFEPDFRTVESAYATLVYQTVVKHVGAWDFRVLPYDTAKSWFWQRVTHERIVSNGDTSGGRMPLYQQPLTSTELKNISTWILNGARDAHGQAPSYPNKQPNITGYFAVDSSNYSGLSGVEFRQDSLFYNPFEVSNHQAMLIGVEAIDDSTDAQFYQNCKLKFSLNKDNFSNALSVPCTYLTFTDSTVHKLWICYVNTAIFPSDTTVYFRYYVNDNDHPNDAEFPLNESLFYYKGWWSFYIKP